MTSLPIFFIVLIATVLLLAVLTYVAARRGWLPQVAKGVLVVLVATALAGVLWVAQASSGTVQEGILFSVQYRIKGGRTAGFTRLNLAGSVPADEGSWNIDAYGRLTRDFLIITRPQLPELEPEVIPVHRLISVQFGDGGIKTVNENQPAPAR